MAQFKAAYDFVMQAEDPQREYKKTPDPTEADKTACAIAGVNSAAWPEDFARIAKCGPAARAYAVEEFYRGTFWAPLGLAEIAAQEIADRVLDAAVNQGPRTAVRLLQQGINDVWAAISESEPSYLDEDGRMGPLTIAAANSCPVPSLKAAFQARRDAAYERIGGPNLPAWKARAAR